MGIRKTVRILHHRMSAGSARLAALVCLVLLPFFPGCESPSDNGALPRPELPVVSVAGYQVPQFPTTGGQLNYAKSSFTDAGEKKAALAAVCMLFPGNREACGRADLALAYMYLGHDYRFATRPMMLAAIDGFRRILTTYQDLPEIQAKAHWYLGWIYCDLMGEARKGLVYFRSLVRDYPGLPVELSSPVPWVSLVFPPQPTATPSKTPPPKKHWAGLALLEIIKSTQDREEAYGAFEILMRRYPSDPAVLFAARHMLADPLMADAIRPYLPELMDLAAGNPFMARDLNQLGGIQ